MPDYLLVPCVIVGFLLGAAGGLTPGLHVNNFAALLLAISPRLIDLGLMPHHLAAVILASSISQTFLDVIPAVFVGAPDSDTVLAVLPGHQLMLEGRGMEAIRLSALGSAGAIVLALALLYPLMEVLSAHYEALMEYVGLFLLAVVVIMVLTETGPVVEGQGSLVHLKYKGLALLLFLASGLLGTFAFDHQQLAASPAGLKANMLLPLLSGLFGASFLVMSLSTAASIPPQRDTKFDMPPFALARSIFLGGLSGSLVAWIPGITPALATAVTRLGAPTSPEEFLVSISGVNTANAVFSLVALYAVERSRSGAAAAIGELTSLDRGLMMIFLTTILVVSVVSYLATIKIGHFAAVAVTRINYRRLCTAILTGLAVLSLMFTGWFGTFVFVVSTTVGLIAPVAGIRRSHAMGVLILPLLVRYL